MICFIINLKFSFKKLNTFLKAKVKNFLKLVIKFLWNINNMWTTVRKGILMCYDLGSEQLDHTCPSLCLKSILFPFSRFHSLVLQAQQSSSSTCRVDSPDSFCLDLVSWSICRMAHSVFQNSFTVFTKSSTCIFKKSEIIQDDGY